jgi:hypothetical protein
MTYGVSRGRGVFEWAGKSLRAAFAQRKNLVSLQMWRMIFDIIRFNQFALDLFMVEQSNEDCMAVLMLSMWRRLVSILSERATREHFERIILCPGLLLPGAQVQKAVH